MNRIWTSRWTKAIVFTLCLVPLANLAWRWHTNDLGINRLEFVARYTGDLTLRFLLASLAITPLRRLPGQSGLIRFRRMLGLFAFFYGCLHALHYYVLDVQWDWEIIWEDFTVRRFFIAGLIGLLLMAPLAATSFSGAIRWLGGRRWQQLHRLAYVSAIAGVVHYFWQGKAALRPPIYYGICVFVLLSYRAMYGYFSRKRNSAVRIS